MMEIFKSTILPMLKLRRVSLVLKTENKSYLLRISNDEYEIKIQKRKNIFEKLLTNDNFGCIISL